MARRVTHITTHDTIEEMASEIAAVVQARTATLPPDTHTTSGDVVDAVESAAETRFAIGSVVRGIAGPVFDVAVDLRTDSPRFGGWVARDLSAETGNDLYIPPGFGRGYQTLEPESVILYWTNQRDAPESATGMR